jgi:hypothetical protein
MIANRPDRADMPSLRAVAPASRYSLAVAFTLTVVIALAPALAGAAGADGPKRAAVPQTEEVTIDGVLHVRNPAEPPGGIEHWYLEEEWCVGCRDGDMLLGLPTRATTDAAGRVYILDAQLNHVHVYSPEGERLKTYFREGEGPGEIRNPSDLVVWPDGAMGVLQEFPGQLVRLDAAGNPLPIMSPGGDPERGGWGLLMTGRVRGEQIVLCGQMTRQDEDGKRQKRQFLASFAPDGKELAAFIEVVEEHRPRPERMREKDLIRPFFLGYDVAPDGRVFVVNEWDTYSLYVFRPGGGLDRIIERDYEPWRRTEADRERLRRMFGGGAGGPGDAMELAENAPCISILQGGVQVSDEGELWVLSSRGNHGLPDGVLARFDVFDGQGHFRRQVEIHCPGDPLNDRLLIYSRDRVIRSRRFVDAFTTSLGPGGLPPDDSGEDIAPAVICYRVRR